MNITGKNVYISGGSSGIGLACAKFFAARGAHVVIFARDAEKLSTSVGALRAVAANQGVRVSSLCLDVADPVACETKLAEACVLYGAPTILINSAGVGGAEVFERESFERFDLRIKVNLYGVRNVIAAVLPFMKKEGGYIVNISSMAGLMGVFGFTSYGASKFAVVGFSEALRAELKAHKILVSVYCPPDVDTPMLAANADKPPETLAISGGGGLMSADEAAVALYEGMATGRFLVVPGAKGKLVNLLNRWAPRLREMVLDRIAAKAARKQ